MDHFDILQASYKKLFASNFLPFNYVKDQKNVTGVYIIYSPDYEVIYVGSTNKFNIRFGVDLKHESTHTLIRKFLKNEIYLERHLAVNYITLQCKFKIHICESKREAEALEHFAIWALNPKFNK